MTAIPPVLTLVLALLLISAASSLVFRGRFTARRVLPRFASVGVPLGYRVAIANRRLVALADGRVTFRWKDYAHGNRQRLMTLDAVEFLRRFLQLCG